MTWWVMGIARDMVGVVGVDDDDDVGSGALWSDKEPPKLVMGIIFWWIPLEIVEWTCINDRNRKRSLSSDRGKGWGGCGD